MLAMINDNDEDRKTGVILALISENVLHRARHIFLKWDLDPLLRADERLNVVG